MNPNVDVAIRRILVAIDGSSHSLAALDAAADLASRLRAELSGLFVEDIIASSYLGVATSLSNPPRSGRSGCGGWDVQLRCRSHIRE